MRRPGRGGGDRPRARAASHGEELIEIQTLTDGGQRAVAVAHELADFVDGAQHTLEIAVYDFDLGRDAAEVVVDAIKGAAARGVEARLAYNVDYAGPINVPPPPRTDVGTIDELSIPCAAIPGVPDLMHHKYVVRDGNAVWSGSANWTDDSWQREENVIAVLASAGLAAAYRRDFDALWRSRQVDADGAPAPDRVEVDGVGVRAWFCPAYGRRLSARIAGAIASARERVRVASPVITSGPILGALAEVAADRRVSLAGVVDATQIKEVYGQWRARPGSRWKLSSLGQVLAEADFTGKPSTPYAPGSVHDYMHAKVTVADSVVFVGSFNLSHSGELNAENVLEIEDADIADRLARFIDDVRGRYPKAPLPHGHTGPA